MSMRFGERLKETTTTTGTGDVTLAGAVSGYNSFGSVCENGDTIAYTIDNGTGDWETGIGTYVSSGTKLQRTTVISSSNANALVNFSAGTKGVWNSKLAVSESPTSLPHVYNTATNQYIALAAAALFTTIPATFTIEWWQITDEFGNFCAPLALGSGGDEFMVYTNDSSGVNGFGLSLTSQGIILRRGTIKRISLTRNGTVAGVFLDGRRVRGTGTFVWGAATGPVLGNSQRRLMGDGGSEGMNGMGMADLRVWNAVRTDQQIADNAFKYLAKGDTTNLLANWPLDEMTGTAVRDRSGNGYNGVLTNSPLWRSVPYRLGSG